MQRQETTGNAQNYTERLLVFLDQPTSHIFHLCHAVEEVLRATSEKHADFDHINSVSQGTFPI